MSEILARHAEETRCLFRCPLNVTTAMLQNLETHTKEQELKMGVVRKRVQ
jgi:hypothetical protein